MRYNHTSVELSKSLRKNMTPWERKLWYCFLKDHQIRFQRQKTIGRYIVDFYCAKANLVIELDGGGHYNDEMIQKDRARTAYLESMGIHVIRFCNLDIDRNFDGVCTIIDMNVSKRL